jgi:uncharacterized MAPEG superfamily protein
MIEVVTAVLVLFILQTFLPPAIQYLGADGSLASRATVALGPRDTPPPMPVMAGRAQRALRNMMEAMFVFIPLALLAIVSGKDQGLAMTGALTFLGARLAYLPAYMSGIVGVRSLIWGVGAAGLAMMAIALVG